jgi:hypothetical protein
VNDDDGARHHWPEEERSQRVEPRLSRYRRVVRFLQGAFVLGAVDRSVSMPRNQDAMSNVIGMGVSGDASREANSTEKPPD